MEVVDVSSELLLHNSIELLGLTICLRVPRDGQPYADAYSFAQEFPEVMEKLGTMIQYDRFGEAIKLLNVIHKKIR